MYFSSRWSARHETASYVRLELRRQLLLVLMVTVFGSPAWSSAPDLAAPEVYLSDIAGTAMTECKQGWGKLGLDTAAQPTVGRPPSSLRLGAATHEKGLGHHAPGELVFELEPGRYVAFEALVGVHEQGGQGKGSVVFQVFVDDDKRFDSGVMTDKDPARAVHVDVRGARRLRLVSLDAGDGIACDMANWAEARLIRDPDAMRFGTPTVSLCGEAAPEPSADWCGFRLAAADGTPQIAWLGKHALLASLQDGQTAEVRVAAVNVPEGARLVAHASVSGQRDARISISAGGASVTKTLPADEQASFEVACTAHDRFEFVLTVDASDGPVAVQLDNVRVISSGEQVPVSVAPPMVRKETFPPDELPKLDAVIEQALMEWDWRMQDGIGTPREAVTFKEACETLLSRGGALLAHLEGLNAVSGGEQRQWEALRKQFRQLPGENGREWEALWLRLHRLKRRLLLAHPRAEAGPIVFAKRVPAAFSHQLTQYYGRSARAGGGIYVLEEPGTSMRCRELAGGNLPPGSYLLPEVSYDGQRVLFAYCEVPSTPVRERKWEYVNRHYHLFEVARDGSGLRQITDGPYDDFGARELPNGQLVFLSTRRGGFHRCGAGPCAVYTLTVAEADGSNPRTISYHETHEWDPSVLADGRIIYTRWDYVDRNAVHYQHLWTVRQDGTAPAAYYGNNTFNPVGVWEARQVPGSPLVMATAAAHHAMTAGSIILLDTTRGIDGLKPITRLTPDAPFPESETYMAPRGWHAPGSPKEFDTPVEARRWPGHCYRSPYPLSEDLFLAAYSFDPLIGEPIGNTPNMFGLYLVDAFGNKELLYRDLNIGSQWPVPLKARPRPPAMPPVYQANAPQEGTFFLQDVHASDPALPEGTVKALRIVQVLPKTTPNANQPPVGYANASPGKQVLGTVPVEADGSACFSAPSGIPLAFQALDEMGRAVQVMRSITYLQPGENASCVGCHEHRLTAPPEAGKALAMNRPPSRIEPGPPGSNPLSYPLLVQPVLDAHCLRCHNQQEPAGPEGDPVVLTGQPEGHYTKSYNALVKRVPYSSWGGLEQNGEPLTQPGRFGAVGSRLMKMLLEGHHETRLGDRDIERLVTWMDANALFYGTFSPEDQARQLRGERIEGPALE